MTQQRCLFTTSISFYPLTPKIDTKKQPPPQQLLCVCEQAAPSRALRQVRTRINELRLVASPYSLQTCCVVLWTTTLPTIYKTQFFDLWPQCRLCIDNWTWIHDEYIASYPKASMYTTVYHGMKWREVNCVLEYGWFAGFLFICQSVKTIVCDNFSSVANCLFFKIWKSSPRTIDLFLYHIKWTNDRIMIWQLVLSWIWQIIFELLSSKTVSKSVFDFNKYIYLIYLDVITCRMLWSECNPRFLSGLQISITNSSLTCINFPSTPPQLKTNFSNISSSKDSISFSWSKLVWNPTFYYIFLTEMFLPSALPLSHTLSLFSLSIFLHCIAFFFSSGVFLPNLTWFINSDL